MAHFPLIRANLAAWGIGTVVDPAEFWALDENTYKSINGDDGGTWDPAAFISVGTAGFEFRGTAHRIAGEISSTAGGATPRFTLDGANGIVLVNTGGTISCVGDGAVQEYIVTLQSGACAQLTGVVGLHAKLDLFGYTDAVWENHATATFSVGSTVTVNTADFDVENGAYINVKSGGFISLESGSTMQVTGSGAASSYMILFQSGAGAQFVGIAGAHAKLDLFGYTDVVWQNHSTAELKSGSTFTADSGSAVTLSGTNTIDGATTLAAGSVPALQDRMTLSGAGQVCLRSAEIVADADVNMSTLTADHYWIQDGVLSVDRYWNLPAVLATTAPRGAMLFVSTEETTFNVIVRDTVTAATYTLRKASGVMSGITLMSTNSGAVHRWHVVGSYTEP